MSRLPSHFYSVLLSLFCVFTAIDAFAQAVQKGAANDVITDPADLVSGLSKEQLADLRSGSKEMADAASKASPIIADKIRGKTASITSRVASVEKRFVEGSDKIDYIRVMTSSDKMRVGGTNFVYYFTISLDAAENEKAAKLKRGDKIKVTGTLSGLSINKSTSALLLIGLRDAKLE